MKKITLCLTAALLGSTMILADASAQSRDLGARRFVLDDGNGNRLYLEPSGSMTGDATYVFPPTGGSAIAAGLTEGQTLRWNNTSMLWESSDMLTNPGSRLGFGTATPSFNFDFRDTLISPTASLNARTISDGTGAAFSAGFYAANFASVAEGTASYGAGSVLGLAGRTESYRGAGNPLNRAVGLVGSVDNFGLGNVSEATGVVGQINNVIVGSAITEAKTFDSRIFNTGILADAFGYYFTAPPVVGVMADLDAFYSEDLSGTAVTGVSNVFRYAHASDPVVINAAGKLSIGTNPTTAGDRLEVNSSSTSNSQVIATYEALTLAPSGTNSDNNYGHYTAALANDGGDLSSGALVGLSGNAIYNRTAGGVNLVIGTVGSAQTLFSATAATPRLIGLYGEVYTDGASTVTQSQNVNAFTFLGGSSSITDAYAFYAGNPVDLSTGDVTNNYGVYIEPLTTGTSVNTAILYDHGSAPFIVTGDGDVGVGNAAPDVALDVSGSFALRNNGVAGLGGPGPFELSSVPSSFYFVSSDPAGSSIGGVTDGTNGKILILYNDGSGDLTITNEDATFTAANRIRTMTGANIATTGEASITMIYNAALGRWIVTSVQD